MLKSDWTLKAILITIALFLGMIAVRPLFDPAKVEAQAARFDHVFIASSAFLYKGQQGLLVMDRRNANVWFFPKKDDKFQDPVFVIRLPFESSSMAKKYCVSTVRQGRSELKIVPARSSIVSSRLPRRSSRSTSQSNTTRRRKSPPCSPARLLS